MTTTAYNDDYSANYNFNCWQWITERLGYAVPAVEIVVNRIKPEVGDIAVMRYQKATSTILHYGYVEGIYDDGSALISECNMWHLYPSGCGYRIIASDYVNLLGFNDQ